MSMEFRTLHSHHQRPIPDGFRRCWAVVPPVVIEALLREERFAPASHDVQFPRERSSCQTCTSLDGWCYHQARGWVVDRLSTVVGQDALEAAVWLHASSSIEVDVGWLDHIPHGFFVVVDVPEDRLLRLHADLFREVALARDPVTPSAVRQHRNREDFLNARDAYFARFPPDLADWPFVDRRLWLEATWEHIFDDALWHEGGFDQLGNDDGCPPVYGVTPDIWLEHVVDVIGCDDHGSVMWREEGDAHDLQLGSRTVHLDASGLRAITDAEVEEESNQLVYACVRGEARVEPQGGEA